MFDLEIEFLVIKELILSLSVGISHEPITVLDHIVGSYLTFNSPYKIKVYYLLMHRQFLWNFIKLIFIKCHSLKKLSGIKHWIRWVQHIPKGSSTYLKSCMVQTFFGGFTDVYGDNNISADKRTQVILVSFFLSHSWFKKHYGSSLTVHRDR